MATTSLLLHLHQRPLVPERLVIKNLYTCVKLSPTSVTIIQDGGEMSGESLRSRADPAWSVFESAADLTRFMALTDEERDARKSFLDPAGYGQHGPVNVPYPVYKTWQSVSIEAKGLAESVLRSQALLSRVFPLIQKDLRRKWTSNKMKLPKRKHVLDAAWGGGLPTTHRPDLELLLNTPKRIERGLRIYLERDGVYDDPKAWDTFALPYLNHEDLASSPDSLLELLEARAYSHPSLFVATELEKSSLGRHLRVLRGPFLLRAAVVLTPESYGELAELTASRNHPTLQLVLQCQALTPGDGILVLQIQDKLYRFLLGCCRNILGNSVIEETERKIGTYIGPASTITTRQPPRELDVELMREIATVQRSEAENQLKLLRSDPGFYRGRVLDSLEHHWGLIKDLDGEVYRDLEKTENKYSEKAWESAILEAVTQSIRSVMVWRTMEELVRDVEKAYRAAATPFWPQDKLPAALSRAIFAMRIYTYFTSKELTPSTQAQASPELRQYFVRVETPDSARGYLRSTATPMRSLDRRRPDPEGHMLAWLVFCVFHPTLGAALGEKGFFDELHRKDSYRDRLSAFPWERLAELARVGDLITELERFSPWVTEMEFTTDDFEEFKRVHSSETYARMSRLEQRRGAESSRALRKAGVPEPGKFTYPIGKRGTPDVLEQLTKAENALDQFWELMVEDLRQHGCITPEVMAMLKEGEGRASHPAPVGDPLVRDSRCYQDDASSPTAQVFALAPEERPQKGWAIATAGQGASKEKEKTRGEADPSLAENEAEVAAAGAQQGQEAEVTFEVDRGTMETVKMVFYVPGERALGNDIHWAKMLELMRCMGFTGQRQWGSTWVFRPTAGSPLAGKRAIAIDAPHRPGTVKLDFHLARYHGRRLSQRYDIDGSNFRLRE